MNKFKIIARNDWLPRCTITESERRNEDENKKNKPSYRRFTATIYGWQNFKIYEGYCFENMEKMIIKKKIRRDMLFFWAKKSNSLSNFFPAVFILSSVKFSIIRSFCYASLVVTTAS